MVTSYSPKLQGVGDVASASPSAGMEAERMRAATISSIFNTATDLYNQYQEGGVKDAAEAARKERSDFFTSNEEAMKASEELAALEKTKMGGFLEPGKVRLGEKSYIEPGKQEVLDNYLVTAARLKHASEQGMSPKEYTTRVRDLTRQAIAAFPAMADTIRAEVARASGLPGADDFAAQHYVERVFGGRGGSDGDSKSEARLVEEEVKRIADAVKVVTPADLFSIRGTPEYEQFKQSAQSIWRNQAIAQQSQEAAQANLAVSKPQVMQAAGNLTNTAVASSLGDFQVYSEKNKDLFRKIEAKIASRDPAALDTASAELDIIGQQGALIISNRFSEVTKYLGQELSAGRIGQADYDSAVAVMKAQKDRVSEVFGPNNIKNTVKVLVAHRDKGLDVSMKIASNLADWAKILLPPGVLNNYTSGDKEMMKQIETQYPGLGKILRNANPELWGLPSHMASPVAVAEMGIIGDANRDAQASPDATPRVQTSPDREQELNKARVETVAAEAALKIEQLHRNKSGSVTRQEANTLFTALNNSITTNSPVDKLEEGHETLQRIFTQLPPEHQSVIKYSLAQNGTAASSAVIQTTNALDKKYNTKLQIGVRSNGSVGVVPPMELFEDRKAISARSSIAVVPKTADFGVFSKYGELRYKQIKPGKEDEVARYVKAATEWEASQRRRANSMVLAEVTTMGTDRKTVGDKVARSLNARTPVPAFYTDVPAAVSEQLGAEGNGATKEPSKKPLVSDWLNQ